ncbi:MAG: type II toxin-antitoxin system HicA family toxin [Anaerolineae bacterium]|nr:type II toxin-antitoxin system HicA family toxin [Anaerolineae bacterium]MCO5207994.1 type II toxin-antitoxin system HicA family toxin [Anaerolineae bacterium]
MSERLPQLSSLEFISTLQRAEFRIVRQKGSHVRMQHMDGRVTTIPVHSGRTIGRGLLRKILRDTELSREELRDLL